MYTQEKLEEDAKTAARQAAYQIYHRTERAKTHTEIAAVMEEELVIRMRHAIREAYFKGLRDAKWEYEDLHDFENFKKAIEQTYEDLKGGNK